MSLSSWLSSIIILHTLQLDVKSLSLQSSCMQIKDESSCIKHEHDCNWNKYTLACVCNIDKNINLIYLLDNNNSYAYASSVPKQKIISYQNKDTKTQNNTSIDFQSAINTALLLFSSYNTHYPNTQNILITSNNTLSPSIQMKLSSLHIHTIFITETQNVFCEIQHYQQRIATASRILLQTNNKNTCCKCLKPQQTAGCPLDTDCEYLVCEDDQICCKESFVGWDEACTETALSICNSPQTPPKTLPVISPNVITPHVISPIVINLDTDFFYETCWEIESDPPCNDAYYANTLGCHWDVFVVQCMCAINNDFGVNIIYLIDISLSAMNSISDYNNIAELITDVTVSTIGRNVKSHSRVILYDENVYIQDIDIDAMQADISHIERTLNTDLLYAIDIALQQFSDESTPTNKDILVVFNGEMQRDYHQDPAIICTKKSELETHDIAVIVTSYTINDIVGEIARDLQCLVADNAYNNIPYVAINDVVDEGWNGFSIKAKLSWDICHAASVTNIPHVASSHTTMLPVEVVNTTGIPEQTTIPIPHNTFVLLPSQIPAPTKPHLITTHPLCPQPQAICNHLQIFIVDICACACIQSSDVSCAEHERFDTNNCECIRTDNSTPEPGVKCAQSVEICGELQIFDVNICECKCRDLDVDGFRCDVNEIYDEDRCQCMHVNKVNQQNDIYVEPVLANHNNFECSMKDTNWNIEFVTSYKYKNTFRCYEYELVIDDKDSVCYGAAANIQEFMIEIPICNNQDIVHELKNKLVTNNANNVHNIEIINSKLMDIAGFGKIYSFPGNVIKIASHAQFTFCLKTNNKNLKMIDTHYNIYGENGYFATDGETKIVDVCSLVSSTNGIYEGNRNNYYYGGANMNMKQSGYYSDSDSSDEWNK